MNGHNSGSFLTRRAFVRSTVAGLAGVHALSHTTTWASWPVTRFPRSRSIQLDVTPNPVPVDAPFSVRLTGLSPGEIVTVRSELHDSRQRWTAEATFEANQQGEVDLATRAPREGTYDVADSMGLIWSALPPAGLHNLQFYAEGAVASPLAITADVAGKEVARVDIERPLLTSAITHRKVEEQGIYGEFLMPATDTPVPAILVLGGSGGGLGPHLVREATLLATHGFASLALAYFGAGPYGLLPRELANIPLEYFAQAIAWLEQQPGVRGDRLGVVGHSRGGELALLLGATYPAFQAVVSYVGSGIVLSGYPDFLAPAWTFEGQPIPHFNDPTTWNTSAMSVERINGPVLVISGEDDRIWPSVVLSQFAVDRLQRMNHPYAVEHLQYADAGHGIFSPYQPAAQSLGYFGGTVQGNAAAMADSWPRVLRLLDERLRR